MSLEDVFTASKNGWTSTSIPFSFIFLDPKIPEVGYNMEKSINEWMNERKDYMKYTNCLVLGRPCGGNKSQWSEIIVIYL